MLLFIFAPLGFAIGLILGFALGLMITGVDNDI